LFYFQIYKSGIHKTCFGKDVLEIFWKEQSVYAILKGDKKVFSESEGVQEEVALY